MSNLMMQRIKRKALHEETVDTLREMIIGGKLAPGERLVEQQLCQTLGISRTPLREAFKLLEKEGLVDLRPNRGVHVSEITAQGIADLFEVVSDLERLAVDLAVQRMADKDFRNLQRRHETMLRQYRAGRRRECFQSDYDIHNFLVKKSGNQILVDSHSTLMIRARRGRYLALFSQERWDEAMGEHEALMEAIGRRDKDAAALLMYRHVTRTGQVLHQSLLNETTDSEAFSSESP